MSDFWKTAIPLVLVAALGLLIGYLIWGLEPGQPAVSSVLSERPAAPRVIYRDTGRVVTEYLPARIPTERVAEPDSFWQGVSTWGDGEPEYPVYRDSCNPIIYHSAFIVEVWDNIHHTPISFEVGVEFSSYGDLVLKRATLIGPPVIAPVEYPFWKDAFVIIGVGAVVYGLMDENLPVAGVGAGLITVRYTIL